VPVLLIGVSIGGFLLAFVLAAFRVSAKADRLAESHYIDLTIKRMEREFNEHP